MKILYLHGLNSVPHLQRTAWLAAQGCRVTAPTLNYRSGDIWERLVRQVEATQPDWLLGFSMGGLAADNLARKYQIPVLSFNPALAYRSFEPAANPWPGLQLAVQHHIVLGELDTTIPPATTRALVAASAEPYTLHPEPLLPHRTNWPIFEKYAQRLLTGHL